MTDTARNQSLAMHIYDRVESLILQAESETQPLEIDPYRGALFELFVTAEGAGFLQEAAEPDLSADALCRVLAERWGLGEAARSSVAQNEKLSPEHISRMRLLWTVMRMWMEWEYAWSRWEEFHGINDE